MKILVFEFITGGGFTQEDLPKLLAKEGLLMLEALLGELSVLASVELTVLLDFRVKLSNFPENIKIIQVARGQSVYELLPKLIEVSDGVWPIAPEMNLELKKISALVNTKNKCLLNSTLDAVVVCGDKWVTYQRLKSKRIAVVETSELNRVSPGFPGKWVIKSKDGVGCLSTYLITEEESFEKLRAQLGVAKEDYIFQPFIKGELLSLSCLFKDGIGYLLCCNRQQILNEKGRFKLISCEVNIVTEKLTIYQNLVHQVAGAICGLWGYVGIDIIQRKEGEPLVLEINPRLTTSYVGIQQATGLNVAKAVVDMIENDPQIGKRQNRTIVVSI